MAKRDVDQEQLKISTAPPPESALKQLDEVFIVVTQAFCPHGHNLIDPENEIFDEYPGIRLKVVVGDTEGDVFLSPFHGDASKRGRTDWEPGTRLDVRCPSCDTTLPELTKCRCESSDGVGGSLLKLYLTPSLNDSHMVVVCNVWGCRHSRTIDNWQIISEFLDGQIGD
jgi:hypothetical protein